MESLSGFPSDASKFPQLLGPVFALRLGQKDRPLTYSFLEIGPDRQCRAMLQEGMPMYCRSGETLGGGKHHATIVLSILI